MPETRTCPVPFCQKDVPTQPDPDGGEVPVFRNHAKGFRQGACPASGEPVDVEPEDVLDMPDPSDDEPREGHGKPPEAS